MITELDLGPHTLRGQSLGGMYTALHVPQFDALLDVGVALRTGASSKHLFLSHAHVDHLGALPSLLGMRGLMGVAEPLTVYAPAPVAEGLNAALAGFVWFGGGHRSRSQANDVEGANQVDLNYFTEGVEIVGAAITAQHLGGDGDASAVDGSV